MSSVGVILPRVGATYAVYEDRGMATHIIRNSDSKPYRFTVWTRKKINPGRRCALVLMLAGYSPIDPFNKVVSDV